MLIEKICDSIGFLLNFLHLTLKRSYDLLTLMLGISSVVYFLYAGIISSQKKISIQNLSHVNPSITMILIIGGLNLIIAYSLWNFRNDVLSDHTIFEITIFAVMIQQLAMGNVLVFLFSLSCLFFHTEVEQNNIHKLGKLIVAVIIATIIYAFCILVMVKLKFL